MSCFIRLKLFTFTVLGGIGVFSYILFLVLCIPMYIYRLLLILLVKWLRHDLSEIISGQNVAFLSDYFSPRPRSNIVSTSVFNGQFTHEEFKALVLERLVYSRDSKGDLVFKKFQQYPVKWMGFGFWKDGMETFSGDNHIKKLFETDLLVTKEQVSAMQEELLNTAFPGQQSPWEFYIVENFKTDSCQTSSLVIFRFHHIFADGYSILSAISSHLCQIDTLSKGYFPAPDISKNSQFFKLDNIVYFLTFPFKALFEIPHQASHVFRTNLWKVPDWKKQWHQIFVQTDPIPITTIKQIKNSVGVTFTSVILSVISAAISKLDEDFRFSREGNSKRSDEDYLLCACILPVVYGLKNNVLTNSINAVLLDLPTKNFFSPCDRLKKLNEIMERSKISTRSYISRIYSSLIGLHCFPLCDFLSKNKIAPITLTNVPGIQNKMELDGRPLLDGDLLVGGFNGDGGVVITVFSTNQQIRIGIIVEEGLMSRKEAAQMASYITDEIRLLKELTET